MPESHAEVYLHFVWTTLQRQPLLTGATEEAIYRCLHADSRKIGIQLVACNGVEDHVHLLARVPGRLGPSEVAKRLKGSSSHLVRNAGIHEGFAWQEGYSVFSVSRWDVPKVVAYIEAQREHHANGTDKPGLEPKVEVAAG
jgi:putative transposase